MESKILTHLAVASSESDNFSDSTKKFVKVLDGLQEVYAKSPESIKKEKLALVIVQMNRDLMSYLKNNELGVYKPKVTGLQTQAQVPQPQQPKPQQQPQPQPQQQQPQQPQPTKTKAEKIAELKGVIAGLNVLVNRGVEGAKDTVSGLKILLRNLEK